MPHTNRIFDAPARTPFVLLRKGNERRLISLDEAIQISESEPSRVYIYPQQCVLVRFDDEHVEKMLVPVVREILPAEESVFRKVRIAIPSPGLPRTHNIGGRGKLMRGGDPRCPNAVDRLVEAGRGRDPILWKEFEKAWAGSLAVSVKKEVEQCTSASD